MSEMGRLSLSLDEVRNIKKYATYDAPYADRVSLCFAFRLALVKDKFREDRHILSEIDALEGLALNSSTKDAEQFKRPPLHPFWHKHFSTPRHLVRNIGERWGIRKGGNHDLTTMIEEVAAAYGDQPELWQKRILHQWGIRGLEDRVAAKRMTGD